MTQTNSRIVIAGLLAGFALASLPAFAQTNAPAQGADQGSGMMMDQGMQQKMSRMMDNCNRMMESMAPTKDGTPAPSAPPNKG